MLSKKFVTTFATLLFTTMFIHTANAVPDIIELKTPEYKKHSKGIVNFSHKKHYDKYGATCGECHHDKNGTPLNLKEGETTDRCVICHTETGKKPKDEKLTKKESIKKYHKKALHANCKECHKKFNKTNGLNKKDPGAAPQDCSGCHQPNKKK